MTDCLKLTNLNFERAVYDDFAKETIHRTKADAEHDDKLVYILVKNINV